MRPPLALLVLGVLVAILRPDVTCAQSVDLYFDEACTRCSIDPPQVAMPFTLYVVLRNWRNQGGRFGGVDFRITGLPSDWTYEYVAHPLAYIATDPFAAGGASIQLVPRPSILPACFVLYSCTITPWGTPTSGLGVVGPLWSFCDNPRDPTMEICSSPADGLCLVVCVTGGRASMDGRPCASTPVTGGEWSAVKSLYRD